MAAAEFSVAAEPRRLSEHSPHDTPWLDPPEPVETFAALSDHGILVCSSVITTAALEHCLAVVIASLNAALSLPLEQSAQLLGEIRAPLFRHDIKLEPHPDILRVVAEVLKSPIGVALASAVGEDARLLELSCIVSDSGARAQPAHCDTPAHTSSEAASEVAASAEQPLLYTVFIPLQSTDLSMGPTVVFPGTHTPSFHARFRAASSASAAHGPLLLHGRPSVALDLAAGAAVCMDSRTWHYGSVNAAGLKPQPSRAIAALVRRCPSASLP